MSRVIAEELDGLRNRIAALEPLEQPLPSAVAPFLLLPGLRGFWPMSAFDSSGNAQDQSGHAHHLTYNGNPVYVGVGLIPYIRLDGTGDYLSRADEADLDITGTEGYVSAISRGLTLGGWFQFVNAAGVGNDELISKYNTTGDQRSYRLFRQSGGGSPLAFSVSSDGTAATLVTATGGAPSAVDTWYFLAARLDPSTSMSVWVNGTRTDTVVGIPASIHSGSAQFYIGETQAPSNPLNGRASLCFLCAAALSDTTVASIFNATRALFGV
jgi:hypothetical protein